MTPSRAADKTPPVDTPPRVVELALAAQDYVRRAVKLELDGSVESLAFLDHYVAQVGDVEDDVLLLLAGAVGSYFGEIVVSQLGGTWHAQGDNPAEWLITLHDVPLSFRPVAMAAEAIRKDDVEEVDARLTTLPSLQGPLAEAMGATGPVEVDYYYSLTGRYETLEHAAELLVELQRQDVSDPPTSN